MRDGSSSDCRSVDSSPPDRPGSLMMRGLARNVPTPWCRLTRPARSSSSSARRTVMRLTPAISASSAWVGSMSPGARLPSATRFSMKEIISS